MSNAKPIPEGFHTITPHLCIRGAGEAIEFYKKAFGAEEIMRMPGPDGNSIMHAQIRIGDSVVFIGDEQPGCEGWASPKKFGGTPVALTLYVESCDEWYQRAVSAGGQGTMAPQDTFWGDRYAMVVDPYGHSWAIATHVRDLTPEEIQKGAEEFFAQMAGGGQ